MSNLDDVMYFLDKIHLTLEKNAELVKSLLKTCESSYVLAQKYEQEKLDYQEFILNKYKK